MTNLVERLTLLQEIERARMTVGDLVVIAYDEASRLTSDPGQAARLAMLAVAHLLAPPRRARTAQPRRWA
jgi:hypothetical protein